MSWLFKSKGYNRLFIISFCSHTTASNRKKIPLSPASRSLTDKIPSISLLQEQIHEGRLTY